MDEIGDPSEFILMISTKKAPWEDYDSEDEDIWAEMRKDSMHLTRSGRYFKLGFLEGDHPGREKNQEADIEKLRERMRRIGEEEEKD